MIYYALLSFTIVIVASQKCSFPTDLNEGRCAEKYGHRWFDGKCKETDYADRPAFCG